ncbi:putative glc8 protein [Rosellinia necatrix]|uniref:Putative glc8 protein n=1 Tax=Rosellinia necatrix TaxID=77044 RepID=A0A1W2TS94_ROSNE|nr:putative glc8 protein [Rosellinia necatrix]
MSATEGSPTAIHSPPSPNSRRPKGILKNSFHKSPPESPIKEKELSEKELTIINTQTNAGHRRSSSNTSRPAGTRRRSSRTSQTADEMAGNQRLQWDEVNLYLTEQERTSTMKITEPKTPYARHYDPSEDEDDEMTDSDAISGFSLGEPEEEVPITEFSASRKQSKVHVSDEDATPQHDAENDYLGMTPEEREKHLKFEQLRKKHYEMKEAVNLLGHPEELDEMEDDNDDPPEMPTRNGAKFQADG